MKSRLILVVIAFSIFLATGQTAYSQEPNTGTGPKDGDACKVTSGPNTGKTGKYTDGASWCEGDWGGTECKDSQGNSKCSPARTVHGLSAAEVVMLQEYLLATAPSADPKALKAWEVKYKAKVLKNSANIITISLANKKMTFDGSAEGLAHALKNEPRQN